MTDPTRSDPLPEAQSVELRISHPVLTAIPTFAGQFAAGATAAAAAGQGLLVAYAALQGQFHGGGQYSDEVLGDGVRENNFNGNGRILKRIAVTGTTNNATNLGATVWASDSGPPLVLADPGTTIPFGVILGVDGAGGAGFADVWQFGLEAQMIMGILQQSTIAAGALTVWGTRIGNV